LKFLGDDFNCAVRANRETHIFLLQTLPNLMKSGFKGNKQSLPSKLCALCGRSMTWRKAWAKNWDSVLYCSDACRGKKKSLDSKAAPHG
jgi:hypothetical protein